MTITGGVDHGDRATTSLIADVLAAHGVQHEWLEPSDAALRWPGMRFDGPVLYQPDRAGRIDADHAVAALTAAAQGRGAQIRRRVTRWLPGLDASRPRPISCTYTSAPDGEFVLERHGPLVVGAGFSGHGFKHAPAVSEALAALATDRVPATA